MGGASARSHPGTRKKKRPALSPSIRSAPEFLAMIERDSDYGRQAVIAGADRLVESAIVDWLPAAAYGDRETRRALSVLASLLLEVCGDRWLQDVVASWNQIRPDAFVALSGALIASRGGDPRQAKDLSEKARNSFGANEAGKLRAELEGIYADQRLLDSRQCVSDAASLKPRLEGRRYRWAMAQLQMEQSICESMRGEFASARKNLGEAIQLAASSNYRVLELRGIGMRAAQYNSTGNTAAAWNENINGLGLYWKGDYPAERAYQFYADMAFAAQRQNRWFLAMAFQAEAVQSILRTANRSTQAMALHRLGTLGIATSQRGEAEKSFHAAEQIFEQIPHDDASRNFIINCEVNLAAIQAARGDAGAPLTRLERLAGQVVHIADISVQLRFNQTLGMLRLKAGDEGGAEKAFLSALEIGDRGFRTLKTDRERYTWELETAKTYRGLVELLLHRGEDKPALLLWRAYRRTVRLPEGKPVESLHALASQVLRSGGLPAGTGGETLLTFAQIGDGFVVWTSDERGVASRIIKRPVEFIEKTAERFLAECSDPDASQSALDRDGTELYRLLIGPLEERLKSRPTVAIETDGILAQVPFQALVDAPGHVWSDRHAIIYDGGIAAPNGRIVEVTKNARALVVGSPALSEEMHAIYPPLPDALREAKDVASRFSESIVLLGKDATRNAVLEQLPSAGVFHFAGHAAAIGAGTSLLLAGNEPALLDSGLVERMRMDRCRLAVLSACSTRGQDDGFRSSGELIRALLRAGVSQVVATSWSVDSFGSVAFMNSFYRTLLKTGSAPEALQQASAEARAASKNGVHPHVWAAYSLYAAR